MFHKELIILPEVNFKCLSVFMEPGDTIKLRTDKYITGFETSPCMSILVRGSVTAYEGEKLLEHHPEADYPRRGGACKLRLETYMLEAHSRTYYRCFTPYRLNPNDPCDLYLPDFQHVKKGQTVVAPELTKYAISVDGGFVTGRGTELSTQEVSLTEAGESFTALTVGTILWFKGPTKVYPTS